MRQLYKNDKVQEYLKTHHSKLWARSHFSEMSKVDYVHNNLVESFNSTIRKLKGIYMVDLLDKIRIEYMQKFYFRAGIAKAKFMPEMAVKSKWDEWRNRWFVVEVPEAQPHLEEPKEHPVNLLTWRV